jgi:hypothetical protein
LCCIKAIAALLGLSILRTRALLFTSAPSLLAQSWRLGVGVNAALLSPIIGWPVDLDWVAAADRCHDRGRWLARPASSRQQELAQNSMHLAHQGRDVLLAVSDWRAAAHAVQPNHRAHPFRMAVAGTVGAVGCIV